MSTHRQRRRRQWHRWILLPGAGLLALALAFWFGLEAGSARSEALVQSLDARLAELAERDRQAGLRHAEAEQRQAGALAAAHRTIRDLEERVPYGDFGGLVDLLRTRIADGVPIERLRFVVGQARAERQCRDGVERRRFQPRLPSDVSPLQTVAFLDNRITVSATASPVTQPDGAPGDGFDPVSPVEIRLLRIGGNLELVKGVLPLGHSVVDGSREYRFTFTSGAKSPGIEAVMQDCAYP
ncbi:hypothetical protein [Geminicoccus flavidas]|uniref:hypothetical protein n=1 Tax=Geminicoccus flavidas TaxID=2506407 RepID=UPI001358AEE6|nr:hypothetical protein [Geminicoccus flavidas]